METVTRMKMCILLFIALLILNNAFPKNLFFISQKDSSGKTVSSLQYELLQKQLNRFYEIEKKGGWKKIVTSKKFFLKGQSDAVIKQVKERLRISEDFNSNDTSSLFTDELVAAVTKVQKRFGFKQNGVIDIPLIKELNVPVGNRIVQLEANMERLRTQPPATTGTRLVANIPEFKLHVYEGSRHVFEMAIVVGTESNRTVAFNDEMTQIVFSPYWNVPPSIVQNEILPAMRKNRNYLRHNGYERIGMEDGLPAIRQKPGPGNSLGLVKFVFPNSHSIYFHDTPAKSLFEVRKRTFSHGCIRLAEPAKLAQYLLRNDQYWTPQRIEQAMHSGKEQVVTLKQPVAVSITYFTAWVDEEGLLNLREDIYGKDKEMSRKIAER
jgi:murein L,D-transpeptidase YcbB/YkuD